MSPQERDEEMLQEYLEGNSDVSRLYRREADEQPNPRLDARILAEAHRARTPKSRTAHSPFARHWMVPTSLAAVLLLSVSAVLLMPDPARGPGVEHERFAEPPPAATTVDAPRAAPAVKRREKASDAEQDVAGERASDRVPRQSPGADQALEKSSGKIGSNVLEPKSITRGAAQSPAATSAAGRAAEQAVAPAASMDARESAPAPDPMPADSVQTDPAAWLRFIERLLNEQNRAAAESNLRAFRARYPDFPLPAALMPLAASLDAQRR